ncbi:MAG: ribosome silencing factor [Rhodoferax sp.]|nr:ribosome silencing factor [Rhodoferax sp.]
MTTDTAAKRDTQKLQRAIVDALEDVKAQDIQVFDTEHLSALFERVIIASGTSNRQTKALAASVRDAVRTAGFSKPRIEGEANGEWIIVDCDRAVVHVMQPNVRQYYHLEELWGEKPVRLKFGAAKPPQKVAAKVVPAKPATAGKGKARPVVAKSGTGTAPSAKVGTKTATKPGVKPGAKPATKSATKPVVRKAAAASAPATAPARRPAKAAVAAPAKPAPRKSAVRKS